MGYSPWDRQETGLKAQSTQARIVVRAQWFKKKKKKERKKRKIRLLMQETMRDTGVIPRSGRSPGEGNGNPLQYSCLENSMDQGAWRATVHSCKELDMTE